MIGVAKGRGPLVFAHIGVLRAAELDVERVFDTSCKMPHRESESWRATNEKVSV